eukprot:GFUD01001585.1.p1 GENE.GFUD01001585.1~~GFUD01001585.1.p1  ORF type:complete len:599 (-),score=180.12 GFUD01001585.1:151-1947(-)
MQYSVPRDQRAFEQPKVLNDWICAKCGVQNFRRREACFKCSGPRTDYDTSNEPTDEVSTHPTNSVLLSGLDALTTEDSVLNTLGPLTKLPLKSVRVGRDPLTNMSRGVCYVEMNSVVDSMFLHNQLIADPPVIDGRQVEVSYHKQVGPQVVSNTSQNQAAANSAMEAAQWTNKSSNQGKKFSDKEIQKMAEYSADLYAKNETERESYIEYYRKYYKDGGDAGPAVSALYGDKKSSKKSSDLGTVTVSGVEYKKFKTPDVSSYQYDETSGYYYDPVSTLYYDANSQYYFNSKTSKFCYWDAQQETFLPAPEGDEKSDDKKVGSKDKVKTAKRIQKDMEKWAKTLNQRKDQSKTNSVVSPDSSGSSAQKGAEDIAFSILQRKEEKSDNGLPGLAGYGSEEEEEEPPSSSSSLAELKLTDWEKLACLLCKRQFQSKEKLSKHNTLSDLHKQNIVEWRKQNVGGAEMGGSNRSQEVNNFQYRDRAKERRNKFGDDDKPVPNKFKEKYLKALDEVTVSGGASEAANMPKIGEENVGNRMLQKMGWKDGLGLGKKNQGRTEIITAQSRTAQSGLGTAQIASNPNDTYKDLARKTLWNRYNSDAS